MSSFFKSLFSFTAPEIDFLFSRAKVALKIPGLTILYWKNDQNTMVVRGKMLIITSRKSGKAVERNLLRRRLKHLFYTKRWFENQVSFIVITYRQVHQFSYEELKVLFETMVQNVTSL